MGKPSNSGTHLLIAVQRTARNDAGQQIRNLLSASAVNNTGVQVEQGQATYGEETATDLGDVPCWWYACIDGARAPGVRD